jgi:hypothetical protein
MARGTRIPSAFRPPIVGSPLRTHVDPELFTKVTGRLMFPRPAPTSPAETFRSFGLHGRASVGYGLGVGSTYAEAGRSNHATIGPGGADGGTDTLGAAGLVGTELALDAG